MLCKHIRSCFDEVADRTKFFSGIQRQRESSFWINQTPSHRPEWRDLFSATQSEIETEPCSDYEPGSDTEFSENETSSLEEAEDRDSNDEMLQRSKDDLAVRNSINEMINNLKSISNTRFLKEYFQGRTDLASDKILPDEITRIKRQWNKPAISSRYYHPTVVYYK